jgi:hypothetical protein
MNDEKYNQKLRNARTAVWLSIAMTIVGGALEYLRAQGHASAPIIFILAASYILDLVAYAVIVSAFQSIGKKYSLPKLGPSAMLVLILWGIFVLYTVAYLVVPAMENTALTLILIAISGIPFIIFGYQLRKLEPSLGKVAKTCGTVHIIAGILTLSVVLFLIGVFFYIAAYVYTYKLLGYALAEEAKEPRTPGIEEATGKAMTP